MTKTNPPSSSGQNGQSSSVWPSNMIQFQLQRAHSISFISRRLSDISRRGVQFSTRQLSSPNIPEAVRNVWSPLITSPKWEGIPRSAPRAILKKVPVKSRRVRFAFQYGVHRLFGYLNPSFGLYCPHSWVSSYSFLDVDRCHFRHGNTMEWWRKLINERRRLSFRPRKVLSKHGVLVHLLWLRRT